MKALTLILTGLMLSMSASASDSWDSCSNADGSVKIENGLLTVQGDEVDGDLRVLSKRVLSRKNETCRLKNSRQRVVSLINEASLEQVRYTYMGVRHNAWVVCERGGSGIPANDSCRD